ncbi:MAG TPA: hypothetical protein VF474_05440 [Phenylobacterium sp.]
MSDLETGATGTGRRTDQAKQMVGQAGQALKAEAQSFASVAQDRVRAEAQKGTQAGAKTLGDFANAVRRAGDELAGSDQSPASRLVRQAADGLESFSRSLVDKEPGDLLNAVRDFGRRNPAAFIGGAVLVGLAVGRFARASERQPSSELGDEPATFAQTRPYDPALQSAEAEPTTASSIGLSTDDDPGGQDGGVGGQGSTTSPHSGGR